MDPNDYTTAWLVYLGAALVMAFLCWRFFRRFLPRELAYLLQCWLLALLLTPWYVLEDQDILAPALMVLALDVITIEPLAGIRALTPLVLALVAGLLVAVALSVVYRVRRHGDVAAETATEPYFEQEQEPELEPEPDPPQTFAASAPDGGRPRRKPRQKKSA